MQDAVEIDYMESDTEMKYVDCPIDYIFYQVAKILSSENNSYHKNAICIDKQVDNSLACKGSTGAKFSRLSDTWRCGAFSPLSNLSS